MWVCGFGECAFLSPFTDLEGYRRNLFVVVVYARELLFFGSLAFRLHFLTLVAIYFLFMMKKTLSRRTRRMLIIIEERTNERVTL